jgi:hypothetical protein
LSLPANATGSTAVTDTPLFKSNTETVKPMQLAQRPYDPSAGSVGSRRPKGPAWASIRPKAAASASRSRGSIDPALLSTG